MNFKAYVDIVHATNAKHLMFMLVVTLYRAVTDAKNLTLELGVAEYVAEYSGAPTGSSEDCTTQDLVRLSHTFSGHGQSRAIR